MMNLVVQGVIHNKEFLAGRIWKLIDRCRDLVGLFNRSDQIKSSLKEIMKEMYTSASTSENEKKKQYKSLKQDVVTRWNSTYQMFDSILVCQHGVRRVLTEDPKVWKEHGSKMLSLDEMQLVEDLCKILEPFQEFTEIMSGSKYATISVVLPSLTRLLEILKGAGDWPKSVSSIVEHLYNDLETRSEQYFANDTVLAATFLDQRFKKFSFIK